jgi:hypothetical protein
MKKLVFYIALIFLISCTKNKFNQAEVVKNCTGNYLKMNNKIYAACNADELDKYSNGTTISVKYKKIKECSHESQNQYVCFMAFNYDSFIELISTK